MGVDLILVFCKNNIHVQEGGYRILGPNVRTAKSSSPTCSMFHGVLTRFIKKTKE
jgi:hypothetical protein